MRFMIKYLKEYKFFLTTLAIISAVILTLFYNALKPQEKLPIYQPAMVNYELVDSSLQHIKKYHKIAPFSLINQNGLNITDNDYSNKIYVADFFFHNMSFYLPKNDCQYGINSGRYKNR